jgi:chromosome segregation ATPase
MLLEPCRNRVVPGTIPPMRGLHAWITVLLLSGNTAGALDIHPDDYRRLLARLSAQDQSIETFRRVLQELRADVSRLRTDQDSLRTQVQAPKNFASLEQVSRLTEQLRRVEQNRVADKTQVLGAIQALRSISSRPAEPAGSKGHGTSRSRSSAQHKKPAGKGIRH